MNIFTKYINTLIETLKENKKLIIICFALYIIIAIASYFFFNNALAANADAFNSQILSKADFNAAKPQPLELFLNNSGSVLLSYFGGIIFGLGSIITFLVNSFSLGYQISVSGFIQSGGSLRFLVYIIPHGIFEITGSILGVVSGLILFRFIWRFLKDLIHSDANGFSEKLSTAFQNHKNVLIQSLVLVIFAIILMMIAAPIESYVSNAFSKFILHY